ncbi:MAG: dihydrolipoyl dehydrogenase [Chitinophagaceae bacterium]
MTYDLAIIGAGPAGYVAAERAGHAGLSVVLFDKKQLGGVCLNEGCIPTKTLLYSAKLYEQAKSGDKYGIICADVSFDFSKISDRKEKIIRKLVGGISMKMKKNKVEVINAEAIIKEKTKEGIAIAAEGNFFECKNLLICTGSEAAIPSIKGLDKKNILTNREILQLKEIPESLNIIGGGVIGIEFANFFSAMGCRVSVFEMMDEILPGIDKDISKILREELTKKGTTFYLNAKVVEVNNTTVVFEKESKTEKVEAAQLLVSVGRKPNVDGIGLENIGVEFSNKGIKIDKNCRTNIYNVYAAGDVTGRSLLAHTASRAGEVVVNNLIGVKDEMRYDAIPSVVYTNPEVSCVGLTEEEAKKNNIAVKIFKLPMSYAGRFAIENEGRNGLCKIIAGEKYQEILGVHFIGNPSSEMIYGASMAIEMQMRVKDIKEIVFPHPTVSEIFKETLFA